MKNVLPILFAVCTNTYCCLRAAWNRINKATLTTLNKISTKQNNQKQLESPGTNHQGKSKGSKKAGDKRANQHRGYIQQGTTDPNQQATEN